jgi:hypothetical protein
LCADSMFLFRFLHLNNFTHAGPLQSSQFLFLHNIVLGKILCFLCHRCVCLLSRRWWTCENWQETAETPKNMLHVAMRISRWDFKNQTWHRH